MLIGEYDHSLDAKGRLIMPAKLREDMGEKFIITTGLDGCLFGFSMSEWEKFEDKLKTLPITNKNARNFVVGISKFIVQNYDNLESKLLLSELLKINIES